MAEQATIDAVRNAVARMSQTLAPEQLDLDLSLIDDLGLDSIRLTELVLSLEGSLGLSQFPMEQWTDDESARVQGKKFTLGSLVSICEQCLHEADLA